MTVNRSILKRTSLVLVMGRPGTGKSTLCKGLLRQISAAYFDIDSVADVFRQYIRNVSALKIANLTLRTIYRMAEQNLINEGSVLLNLPFVHEMTIQERRQGLRDLVERTEAELIIIHCSCSDRELKRRLSSRRTSQDLAKLKDWPAFLRREPPDVTVPFKHLVIDTEADAANNVSQAVEYVLERAGASATRCS
jgi:predicted kinase